MNFVIGMQNRLGSKTFQWSGIHASIIDRIKLLHLHSIYLEILGEIQRSICNVIGSHLIFSVLVTYYYRRNVASL